jgi:uncharacterized membrane protein
VTAGKTMTLLIFGLLLWVLVHLFPALAAVRRDNLIARMGSNAYRALFAILIIIALAMIVSGWKSATPVFVYSPPLAGSPLVAVLIAVAFVLFIAAQARTNIKRLIRHPQLTGLVLWAVAHLLANGDSRSVALFLGFATWGVLEIAAINRRDGARQLPDPVAWRYDWLVIIVAAVAFAVILHFHEGLFGVAPIVV